MSFAKEFFRLEKELAARYAQTKITGIGMAPSVLFIGLGNMGFPMACNLLKKGFIVHGFDVVPQLKSQLEKEGGKVVSSLEKTASTAEVVISMLPGSKELEELYVTKQNLFSFLKKSALIIDCTTADPETSRSVAAKGEKLSLRMLDAPVSGGTTGARQGTLTFIVGGKKTDFEEAKTYLSAMGKNIFHAGPAGNGQAVKICNNMLLAIHMIGSCEALALGKSLGLEAKTLSQIMQASSGNNWSLEKYNPCPGTMEQVPSSKNYEGGFAVHLMAKDLTLAMKAADSSGQKTDLGKRAFEIYKKHKEDGFADKDFSHIFTRYIKS